MKLFSFLAVIVLANSLKLEVIVDTEVENVVFHAIKGILEEHFAPNEPKVNFYFNGPNSEALTELLVREKPFDLTFRMINLDLVTNVIIDTPTILLFDSVDLFSSVREKITWPGDDGLFYHHLIYAAKKDGKVDLHTDFAQRQKDFENQNFLSIVNKTTVDLITSFRFTPGKCNSSQYRTINRFTTDTMKWQNKTFFPEKYENFHGCHLRIGVDQDDKNTVLSKTIAQVLEKHLNFQIDFKQWDGESAASFDLIASIFIQHFEYASEYKFSSVLFNDFVTFTVPTGEPYTQLEKMFLMFDKATWICIGVTLGAAVLVIQFINFMSIKVQKFVFGEGVQTPTLNVSSIFLNGAQHRVPGRNFARYILMMFIMWSLIIRTCYQSELYKNLQGDMRKPRIQTVDELNEQKFTLSMDEFDIQLFKYSAQRIKLRVNETKMPDGSSFALYENKMTALTYRKQLKANLFKLLNQESSLHSLDENTATSHFCMFLPIQSPFSSIFVKKIDQLIASGVIAWFEERSTVVSKQIDEFGPQQLTMDHLDICFLAIMICLGFSCITFIVECSFVYFLNGLSRQKSAQTGIRDLRKSGHPEDVSLA